MNTLWCFLFLSIALVNGTDVVYVPPEYAVDILNAAFECIKSTGAEADVIQKVVSANLEDSETFKKYLYCFATKSGYIDSNGHLIVDNMTKLVGNHKDKAEFIDVINLCNKTEDGDIINTMFKTVVCFKDKSPIIFTV